jgi:hypothetical protein
MRVVGGRIEQDEDRIEVRASMELASVILSANMIIRILGKDIRNTLYFLLERASSKHRMQQHQTMAPSRADDNELDRRKVRCSLNLFQRL